MQKLEHRVSTLSDEDMVLFETDLAKCMECHNWFDVSSLVELQEYACDSCHNGIIKPMKLSEFWLCDIAGVGGMSSVYTARQYKDPSTLTHIN